MDSSQCGTGMYNVGKRCIMMLLQAAFMMLGFNENYIISWSLDSIYDRSINC